MDHRFDTLAKTLSGSLSRRQAFWRLGGGLAAALLASAGIARADQHQTDCAAACAHCCQTLDPPPRGQELAECITACLQDGGACAGHLGDCR
jgi:hypothetical protein